MEVHKSGFSGREDEFARLHALEPEDIILEFRELPGGVAGFVIEDVGREDHLVTVREVVFDEIIEEGPFEAGAEVRVNPSSRAGDLRGPLVINEAKGFGEGDVVFRGEIEVLLFPEVIEGDVVFLAAGKKVIVRKVREDFDEGADFRFDVLEFFLVFLVFRPEGFDFAEDRLDVTAFFFDLRDGGAQAVLLRFVGLDALEKIQAARGQVLNRLGIEIPELFLQGRDNVVRFFENEFDVNHDGLLTYACSINRLS